MLLVDRDPWQLELHRHVGALKLTDAVSIGDTKALVSQVIPFTFRLLPATPRPHIEVIHTESRREWKL